MIKRQHAASAVLATEPKQHVRRWILERGQSQQHPKCVDADYITIVYPHFKCNEQTWMNSIRHVLSTTIISAKYSALPGVRFGQFSIEA